MAPVHARPWWLKLHALVLAKMGHYPLWPAIISNEYTDDDGKRWEKEDDAGRALYWCCFLNDNTGYWIERDVIKSYTAQHARDAQEQANHAQGLNDGERAALAGAFKEGCDRYVDMQLVAIEGEGEGKGSDDIAEGDVIIASHYGFPPWPAIVERADKSGKNTEENEQWAIGDEYHCRFLGKTPKHNCVLKERVVKYTTERMARTTVREPNIYYEDYQTAVAQADDEVANRADDAAYNAVGDSSVVDGEDDVEMANGADEEAYNAGGDAEHDIEMANGADEGV